MTTCDILTAMNLIIPPHPVLFSFFTFYFSPGTKFPVSDILTSTGKTAPGGESR
jgi:hypothetical protein